MKKAFALLAIALAVGMASMEVEAAKRFGGGGNIGKQRAAPTQKEATPAAAPTPAKPASAPAAAPAAPVPKPSFMSKWGGLIAGLGMGALLGSLFSGNMGGMGTILLLLIGGLVIFAVVRALAARRAPMADKPMQFAGIGSAVPPTEMNPVSGGAPAATLAEEAPPVPEATLPPGFEKEPFLRVAKTSFIRLQAANDAKDLDDIRDYTTPEMFAELSMQIRERGDAPQKTEVVLLEAQLVEAVVEADYAVVSVRFYGLMREEAGANPEPFDEVWHVRKSLKDAKATWLIAGIQQSA